MSVRQQRQLLEAALDALDSGASPPGWPPLAGRFRAARERRGLTEAELVDAAGVSRDAYSDVESYDDEALIVLSVDEILRLAGVLQTTIDDLLFGETNESCVTTIPLSELAARLANRREAENLSTEELDEIVGWGTDGFFSDPDSLIEVPIFGLRDFCRAAGIDWFDALPRRDVPRPPDAERARDG